MKELMHLKRLSAVKSNIGIKFLTPAVFPGTHCPMRIASVIVEDIVGLSSLLVGMQECTTHSRLFSPKPEGKKGELHWLYVLEDKEVVFGCREGLMDALRKMDKAGAKAILLIITCVPELIGEDIEGMIHEVQPELSAQVTYVMLGQFKNFSYPPGSWKTIQALGGLMEKKEKNPLLVNVLGRSPEEDHIPMPSLLPELQARGIILRYLAPGASLEDFQNGPEAALNLVVSPYTQPLAVKMEEEFGVPYIALHTLYSVEEIDKAYAEIAVGLNICWDNCFEAERQEALALQNHAKKRLDGLRYISSVRIDLPLPLAIYLDSLGMTALLLHLEEYYPEDRINAQQLIARGQDPWVCRMVNAEADLPIMEALEPDIYFGYLQIASPTAPCVADMFDFYGQTGYGRTTRLLKRIFETLDETEKSRRGGISHGSSSI